MGDEDCRAYAYCLVNLIQQILITEPRLRRTGSNPSTTTKADLCRSAYVVVGEEGLALGRAQIVLAYST